MCWRRSISPNRFNMLMLTVFSGLALALAAIGVYGLTAYAVAQRTREIGIRVSLGARPTQVVRELLVAGAAIVPGRDRARPGGCVLPWRVFCAACCSASPRQMVRQSSSSSSR